MAYIKQKNTETYLINNDGSLVNDINHLSIVENPEIFEIVYDIPEKYNMLIYTNE